jgi:hypothetical protein
MARVVLARARSEHSKLLRARILNSKSTRLGQGGQWLKERDSDLLSQYQKQAAPEDQKRAEYLSLHAQK